MRAAAVAARLLRALGCVVVAGDGSSEPDGGPAGFTAYLTAARPATPGRSPSVRCEITWPGPVDLPLADEAAVQAACGIMHVHGRKSGAPMPLGVDYASTVAGVLAAQGVLAALIAQLRGIPVRRVVTSVAEAALLAVAQYLAAATAPDDWREPLLPGGPPFVSADGVRFEIEVLQAEGWREFWSLAGAEEGAAGRGWRPFEQRYATATCPLPGELHRAAGRLEFADVAVLAARAGISIMPVRADAGDTGPAEAQPAGPVPWRITGLPSGDLEAHDDRPSPGAALPADNRPAAPGVPLPADGIVVIESGRRIQGPLAGHILALLGARVIRIEPPGGDPMRGIPPIDGDCSARFRTLNRGKEVAEVDIKSPAGRGAVRDLVATADVFLHNWAPGRAQRLRLDAEHLAAVNQRLVYAWASGWGDALGPEPPLGTDFMVQAHSGLGAMVRPAGEPPAPSLMTLTDVLGGLICAQGVLGALLARFGSGQGQRVDSSLLSAAMLLRGTEALPARAPAGAAGAVTASVLPCTDLSAMAADRRFAAALCRDGAVYPRSPWRFSA